ncbi:unnamed protein product [Microthlaspi erraticum]|uniref:Uncharacterized protein n=1 Tax=Microthlaspi erraticum TaxID=1685480 RepID=A0A6D2IM46_9BRAS|nr:unnamed protein product [Microthlaspi erraticum]
MQEKVPNQAVMSKLCLSSSCGVPPVWFPFNYSRQNHGHLTIDAYKIISDLKTEVDYIFNGCQSFFKPVRAR